MEYLIYAGAALWGGVWWRLRGGALTALTGFDPGTGGMRAIAAVGMGAPLAAFGWQWLAMVPALWVAWSCAGWGAFQGMGADPVEMSNPLAALLSRWLSGVALCLVGMAIEGWAVTSTLGLVVWWRLGEDAGLPLAMSGLMFAPLYLFAQRWRWLPDFGRFARAGSEWAEVAVGAWVGFVLAWSAMQ